MNYLINLFLAIITLPGSINRINSDLLDQRHRDEQLTRKLIRLETILEMYLKK